MSQTDEVPVPLEFSNPTFDEVDSSQQLAVVPVDANTQIAPLGNASGNGRMISSPGENGSSEQPAILHAVAQKEAQQEMVAVNVTQLQAENDSVRATARIAEKVQVKQNVKEHHEIVITDKGAFLRKRTVFETLMYREIKEELYLEAKQQPQLAIEGGPDQEPEAIPTTFEKGIDICCQSCTCNFQNPFKRQKEKPLMKKKVLMTPTLRRGRAKGWSMYSHFAFPLVGDVVRVAWIFCELILVFLGTIFSIATFSAGSNASFNIFHLVLSFISAILAIFDAIYSLSLSCCKCIKNMKERNDPHKKKGDTASEASNAEYEKPSPDSKQEEVESELSPKSKCARCKCCKTFFDVARTALTELILVPLLICDIFEVVTGAASLDGEDSASNYLGLVLFAIGCIGVVLYVYVIRLCILIGMIYYVQGARTPEINDEEVLEEVNYDPSYKKYALIFQIFFLLHVAGQMVAQVFMLIAIGGKVRYDNRHLYGESLFDPTDNVGSFNVYINSNTEDDDLMTIRSSPELIYMCIAVTILPICGFLSFFIVTNFWVQEFPISLCIDVVKILQMPGPDDVVDFKDAAREKAKEMSRAICEFVRIEKLKSEYNGLRNTAFLEKLFHPFKSPGLVILCLLYGGGQLAFVICAATATNEMGRVVFHILNGGGWVVYYIIAVVVGVIANLYAFAVAGVWIIIIAGILALIALIIGLLCLAACLATTGSSDNRRRSY